jgi:hypothetical protein
MGQTFGDPGWMFAVSELFHMTTALKTHLLIHTGGKPFQCWQCPKYFNKQIMWPRTSFSSYRRETFQMFAVSKLFHTVFDPQNIAYVGQGEA